MVDPFPYVRYREVKKCKLFNEDTMKYLCLSDDTFITTLDQANDSKANFDLHFFHTRDKNNQETQLVVPVHSSQNCLIMTPERRLSISKKKDCDLKSTTVADSRFFYYKCLGPPDLVAFEGMNGTHDNYYLAVNENNMKLELQEKKGESYPRNMIFIRVEDESNEV